MQFALILAAALAVPPDAPPVIPPDAPPVLTETVAASPSKVSDGINGPASDSAESVGRDVATGAQAGRTAATGSGLYAAAPAAARQAVPALPPAGVTPYAMRPGYGLELYTEESCAHCPEAKRNAAGSGVPVEVIDCNAQPQRAASHGIVSVPTWVLTQEGREVMRWTGPGKRSSVRLMAAYEAPERIEARGLDRAAGTAARVSGGTVPAPVASASDLSKTYKSPPNVPPGGWYPHPPVASGGYYTGPLPAVEPGAVVTSVDGRPVGNAICQFGVNRTGIDTKSLSATPQYGFGPDPRPGHWSVSGGEVYSHLLRDHGIDASGVPYEAARTAHDIAHEQGRAAALNYLGRGGYGSAPAIPQRAFVPASSACPGGNCGVGSRRSGGFFSRLFGG